MNPQDREHLISLINDHIEFIQRSFGDPDTDFQQLATYNGSFLTTVHYDTEWNEIIKKFLGESVSTESYAVLKTNEQLRNNIRSALLAYLNKLVITIRQQEGGMVAEGIVPVKEDLDRWGQEAEAARAKQVEQRTHIRQWREKWVGRLREQEATIQQRARTEFAKVRADLPSYITSNPAPIIGAMIVGARDIAQAPKSEQLQVEKAAQKRVQAQVEQQALSMGLPRSAARAAKGNTAIFTAMTMLHQSAKEDLAEVPGTDEFNERVERLTEASGRVHSTVAAHVLDAALQVANDRQRAQIESFIHRLHYDGTLDQTYQEASLSQRKQLETFVRAVELDPATAGQLNLFYLSDTRTLLDVAREFEAQHQPTLAQFKPPEFAVLPLLTADKVRAAFDFKPGTSKIGDELIMSTANYLVGRDALLAKFGYDRTQAEKLLGAYLSRSDLKARFDSLVKMYGYDAALKEVYASSLSRGAYGPEFMSRLGELKTRFISRLEELGIQLPRQVSQGFFGEGLPSSFKTRKEAVSTALAGGPSTAGAAPSLTPFWRGLRNLGGRIPFFQQLGWSRFITFMSSAFPGLGRFFGSAATPAGNMVTRSLGDLGGGVRDALTRQAARRVAQGIGQTGARALISRLIPSWVVALLIGAVVFVISTGFTFPTAEFTVFMQPAGGANREPLSPASSIYLQVQKTVDPATFSSNSEARGKTLRYTITVTAKLETITITGFDNQATITRKNAAGEIRTTPFSITDISAQFIGKNLAVDESLTGTYEVTLPTDGSVDDSIIADTLSVSGTNSKGTQTSYGAATVIIGTPPDTICNTYPQPGGRKYCYPVTPIFTSGASCTHHDYVATDIVTRKGQKNPTVIAFVDGVILSASSGNAIAGNAIIQQGDDDYIYGYYHLNSMQVRSGQRVTAGQPIGEQGATGNAAGLRGDTHFQAIATVDCPFSNKAACADTYRPNCLNKKGTNRNECVAPHTDLYVCPTRMFDKIFKGAIPCDGTSYRGCGAAQGVEPPQALCGFPKNAVRTQCGQREYEPNKR